MMIFSGSVVCVALLFASLTAVTAETKLLELITSQSAHYVLMGEYSQLMYNSSQIQCNYSTDINSSSLVQVDRIKDNDVVFTVPGQYYYQQCTSSYLPSVTLNNATHSVGFQVITVQHKVTVCNRTDCIKSLHVTTGDVVYWTTIDYNCTTIELVYSSCYGNLLEQYNTNYNELTGLHEGYRFNQKGEYHLFCVIDMVRLCQPLLSISVVNNVTISIHVYKQLVYSHAGIMAVTFGIILPLGALLASYKLVIPHIILQICGQIFVIIGFILVIVYNQLNDIPHFYQVHSIVGLVIILLTIIIQPLLRLLSFILLKKQGKIWHKRLGISIVFFGLSNVFLGMLVLGDTPLYIKILYGIWVLIAVTIYVICGALTNKEADDAKELNGSISLAPPVITTTFGPSKLSKELINERSFIQIRKKSIDILASETPFVTPANSNRQRKMSNVHFGPVLAEQLSPVLPNTPVNISGTSNFGFGGKNKYTDESDDSNDKGDDETTSEGDETTTSNDSSNHSITDKQNVNKSIESIASLPSNGGSLRITRHSSRAHTKASEIFQRSYSFSRPNHLPPSISINSETPLLITSPTSPDQHPLSTKMDSAINSDDEEPPKQCPFTRSAHSDSVLPLRQRRTGLEMQIPKPDNLSIGRPTPSRSPSRSPSFSRKKRDQLVDNTLRSVMQMSDDAIVSANAQGEIVFWSNGAMKIFGYTPGEAIGSSLQMVMPQRYKEKHQNGVNKKTEYALDYIKKHNTAPQEQKHARLYAVHGVSKSGKEFGVEVLVSSFVIEGEIFYTGIITETDKGLTRQLSATSLNSETGIREKQQKAIAIGTQMKIAHKLQSAEQITKFELETILDCSLKASLFEVPEEDISKMVDGIIQAADPDECGVVRFAELIDLLAKHRLYISDSGIIAKYGKSKAEGNLNLNEKIFSVIGSFFSTNLSSIFWIGLYLLISIAMILGGILLSEKDGWQRFAYGTGSLLSFNCILVLLTSLKGIIYVLKGNSFLVKVFPFDHITVFHCFFSIIIILLSIQHTTTHLCSFALDNKSNETTTHDHFLINLKSSVNPVTTGIVMYLVVILTMVWSLSPLRKLCNFIGFYTIHWISTIFFYTFLIIHGNNHFNPNFWKWLLPALIIIILDRIYLLVVLKNHCVDINKVFAYDETSRTTFIEINKPKRFKFIPGQFIQLNIPQIGYFNWQSCKISSSNKEDKLKLYLPHNGSLWLTSCYQKFKSDPLNPKPKDGAKEFVKPSIKGYISGPYGCGTHPIFNYQVGVLVCGYDGPNVCRSIIQTFLEYRRSSSCHCGCHPVLTKLYFIWVIPSGNDYEWFTDFLSDIIEDKHIQRYLDIRIYLTNINSPPDELAAALLHLALKTGGPALSVKRPSQPQLSKLHSNTSYGNPDFESLLDFVSMQQGTSSDQELECGVFTVGKISYTMKNNLKKYCNICSRKRGPTACKEMDINSPYRRKLSTSTSDDKSSSPQPKEWHISFILDELFL